MRHSRTLMAVSISILTLTLMGGVFYLYLVNLERSQVDALPAVTTQYNQNTAVVDAAIVRLQSASSATNLSAEEKQVMIERLQIGLTE